MERGFQVGTKTKKELVEILERYGPVTTTLARTTLGWTASSRPAPLDTSASSRRNAILNSKVP